MKLKTISKGIVAASLVAASSSYAADVRINGFMSVVGGMTTSEGQARLPAVGTPYDATFDADTITEGVYDDDFSFKPDSNFGLQITADLGEGLQAIGQITGNGGEDYDPNVSWAYLSYEVTDEFTFQAGRQRLPLFFYSDFLDVAYSYHWIRPSDSLPQAAAVDTVEGFKLVYTPTIGDFDARFQFYAGSGDEALGLFGGAAVATMETVYGLTAKVSNDWLQLRFSYMTTDVVFSNIPAGVVFQNNGIAQATDDDPTGYDFYGLAAHMTFDNVFVVTEVAFGAPEEGFATDFGVNGKDEELGWYISSGIRLGDFTPHITYGSRVERKSADGILTGLTEDAELEQNTITLGLRWDFHPSAAFKVEYLTRSDDSDDVIKNNATASGLGLGDSREVDVFSFGFDVIF